MTDEPKLGWFKRLKAGLTDSSRKISDGITAIVTKRKLDETMLQELEELLIMSDLGVKTSSQFVEKLAHTRFNQEITDEEIRQALAQEVADILEPVARPLAIDTTHKPFVVLVVGVNGSGKTTTIGKLAKYWQGQGHQIRLVAGDTFRAAAVEQLQVWAQRIGVPMVKGAMKADAAGLVYEAYELSRDQGDDILMIDTAGRLQNKADLMAELSKIRRVLQKLDATAPHSCLLVLDATVGQNAHSQVEIFAEVAKITGLVMTKLDGTARGGVLVSLAEKFKYPIHAIGVGEGEDDLRPFTAEMFAKNLVNIKEK